MQFIKKIVFIILILLAVGKTSSVFAAGNIDSVQKYSQFLDTDLDGNSIKDFINWSPTTGGATVSDTAITGYIWGETVGWINLNPTSSGVTNTCSGILAGYAWGENTGWVNFAPTSAIGINQPKINTTTGAITGSVWSENYGWITLSSSNGTYPGLITSWRGCSSTSGGGSSESSGGGSGSGSSIVTPASPIPGALVSPSSLSSSSTALESTTPPYLDSSTNTPLSPTNTATPLTAKSTIPSIPQVTTHVLNFMNTIDSGTLVNMARVGAVIALVGLLSTIPGLITRFGNLLLTLFFVRKQQRGVVFDSETKETLDPAYVTVMNAITGQEVATAITDINGRFGFILKRGTYRITANKTHYRFPSTKLMGQTKDSLYDNLYFGEVFTVTDQEAVITMNIPMDSQDVDWNQQEKKRKNLLRYVMEKQKAWGIFFDILLVIGFFMSVITTYYYPTWWNILMVVLYIIVAILHSNGYGPITSGTITKNSAPLKFGIVRAFNANLNREIAHKVTTELGSYMMLVPKADYYVTVEEKNPDGTYAKIYTSDTMRADHGLINKSFEI